MADQSDDELLQIDNLIDTWSSKMTTHSDFQRYHTGISANLSKISNNTGDLENLIRKIGTPDDSEPLRERYLRLQKETKVLMQQTNNDLKQLQKASTGSGDEQRQRKAISEKLSNQSLATFDRFRNAQRTGLQKEKESLNRAQAVAYRQQSTDDSRFGDSFPSSNNQLQEQTSLPMEQGVNMEGLEERGEQIRRLETDIVEVNELFKDVAKIVHEHGDIIVSIENAIIDTETHVVTANSNLSQAVTYQSSARRKKIIIITIVIILLVILGLGLYFGLRK